MDNHCFIRGILNPVLFNGQGILNNDTSWLQLWNNRVYVVKKVQIKECWPKQKWWHRHPFHNQETIVFRPRWTLKGSLKGSSVPDQERPVWLGKLLRPWLSTCSGPYLLCFFRRKLTGTIMTQCDQARCDAVWFAPNIFQNL